MIDPATKDEMIRRLEGLPPEMQRRVLDFARALALPRPRGIPGPELLRFAGTLTRQDADEMQQAIEPACERVDPNAW
jgi:hypothetical protein